MLVSFRKATASILCSCCAALRYQWRRMDGRFLNPVIILTKHGSKNRKSTISAVPRTDPARCTHCGAFLQARSRHPGTACVSGYHGLLVGQDLLAVPGVDVSLPLTLLPRKEKARIQLCTDSLTASQLISVSWSRTK